MENYPSQGHVTSSAGRSHMVVMGSPDYDVQGTKASKPYILGEPDMFYNAACRLILFICLIPPVVWVLYMFVRAAEKL